MKLVPENISEAIKHLSPRTEEEVDRIKQEVIDQCNKMFIPQFAKNIFTQIILQYNFTDFSTSWNILNFTINNELYYMTYSRSGNYVQVFKFSRKGGRGWTIVGRIKSFEEFKENLEKYIEV